MKSRLSSTIWLLVFWMGLALFGVLGLAYYAGAHSVGQARRRVARFPAARMARCLAQRSWR